MFCYFALALVLATCQAVPTPQVQLVGAPNSECLVQNAYYRVEGSCDNFVKCTNYKAEYLQCTGGYYFNPQAQWPNYPCAPSKDVYCPDRSAATQPAPVPQVQPAAPHSPECFGRNAYYRVEDKCETFVNCTDYKAEYLQCTGGYNFNPQAQWPNYPCAPAKDVPCPVRGAVSPVAPPTQVQPVITHSPECRDRNAYYRVDGTCDTFVNCTDYKASYLQCTGGYNYNPQAQWPNYPCGAAKDVPCPGRGVVQPTNTTVDCHPRCGSAHDLPPANLRSAECLSRNAYYKWNSTCDAYIKCIDYIADYILCPDGLYFNPEIQFPEYPCRYPSEVSCQGRESLQPAQPTADCPHQYGYFPSPYADALNCGQFRSCIAGKATEMTCAVGLAFNPETSRCDWADVVSSCRANDFIGFTCPPPPNDYFGRPIKGVHNYKYEGNCFYFYSCENDRGRLLSCDAGLAFDASVGRCRDADLVDCDC